MLFSYMVLIQLAYDIRYTFSLNFLNKNALRFILMNNPYLAASPDKDAPFNIFGIRIDRITYYLSACAMTTCVFYGTFKSFQRFLALYFPFFYNEKFKPKQAIVCCLVIPIIVHVCFIPVLFIPSG